MTLVTLGDVLGWPNSTPELILFCNQSAPAFYRKGGPRLWDAFMRELRSLHTGGLHPRRSVLAELQAAYEKVAAKRRSQQ